MKISQVYTSLFLSCLTIVLINCDSNKKPNEQYVSDTLEIKKINDNVYQHISYLDVPDYGPFPCNGVVFFSNNEAIVFDTPTNDSVSNELINWIMVEQKKKIKAVVVNHFHDDCIGGLKAFHEQNIPSYASNQTIDLAAKHDAVLPLNGFDQFLDLSIGNKTTVTRFVGPGHTSDNVVSYIPSEQVLFGGCLIKEVGAGKGNLNDANIKQWSQTVRDVKTAYPGVQVVVPGHGAYGGSELYDYTISLFEIPKN